MDDVASKLCDALVRHDQPAVCALLAGQTTRAHRDIALIIASDCATEEAVSAVLDAGTSQMTRADALRIAIASGPARQAIAELILDAGVSRAGRSTALATAAQMGAPQLMHRLVAMGGMETAHIDRALVAAAEHGGTVETLQLLCDMGATDDARRRAAKRHKTKGLAMEVLLKGSSEC